MIPSKDELCRILEKKAYQRSSAWHKESRQEWISYGGSGVMQLDVNPRKTDRTVSCNIVYVMFLVVCNSIINKNDL